MSFHRCLSTIAVLLLSSLIPTYAGQGICLGGGIAPELDAICKIQTTKSKCLERLSIETEGLTASCIWRQISTKDIIDLQDFSSTGGIIQKELKYDETYGKVCGAVVETKLAKGLSNLVGVTVQQLAGPNNNNATFNSPFGPNLDVSASTCYAGQPSNSRSCKTQLIPVLPLTYNADYKFYNKLIHAFTTSNQAIINATVANGGRLPGTLAIKYTLKTQALKCQPPGATNGLKATPVISDEVVFGPTPYQINHLINDHYSMLSYRVYLLTNLTGVDWSAKISKSYASGNSTSPLTVFLMRGNDYKAWLASCSGICNPPADKFLKESLCTGSNCKGKVRGLGANATGGYYLWVSYPKAYSPSYNGTVSNTGPITSKYYPQAVNVVIQPRYWSLKTPNV